MFTKSFTDPQGTSFTDAVFIVRQANMTDNRFSITRLGSEGYKNATVEDTTNKNLAYQMLYFKNQAALDEGKDPYPLFNTDTPSGEMGDEKLWFRVDGLGAEYDGLTAAEASEKHCQEVVLAQ